MKIMTFNILMGVIDEDGSRIDFIKEAISEASPDFVALQEANDFEKDNNRLLREVSQHTGLQYHALSPGSMREGRQCHLATLSRYPFRKKYVLCIEKWLRKSEQGDKWNRCLIEGMIVLSETGARDEQTTPP